MKPRNLFLIIALLSTACFASALSDTAYKMDAGEWKEFHSLNWNDSLISTGIDNILNYSNSGVWDPIRNEIRFVGQGHYEKEKMIIYDDSTNTWRIGPSPFSNNVGHGYDHNTLNPATGISYYRGYYSTQIRAYKNGIWDSIPSLPGSVDSYTCCGALEYWPDYNGLTFWYNGRVLGLKNNEWTFLIDNSSFGFYHNITEYSKPYKLLFGGGGVDFPRVLYSVTPERKMRLLPSAPADIGVNVSLTFCDPITGEFLLLSRDSSFWAYNPDANAWRALPRPPNAFLENDGDDRGATKMTVVIPIEKYGVTMFLHRKGIVLYKHAKTESTKLDFILKQYKSFKSILKKYSILGRAHA